VAWGRLLKQCAVKTVIMHQHWRTLVRQGRFDEQAGQQLQRFFVWLLESPIVISDLTLDNLVYRYDAANGEYFC